MRPLLKYLFASALMTTVTACSNTSPGQEESKQENKDFYPVKAFIMQELKVLDSLPVAVFLYRESNRVSDTQLVDKSAFRTMAEQLCLPDITVEPLKKNYRETVYMDNTLNLVTLSYSTDIPDLEIRKIDVYVNPETDKVKNIYIEKSLGAGDSVVSSKLVWTSGKQVQISRIVTRKNGEEQLVREKYSWAMPQ